MADDLDQILERDRKYGRWPDWSKFDVRVAPDEQEGRVCIVILYADEVKFEKCLNVPNQCTNELDGTELFELLGCKVYLDNTEICLTRSEGEVWAKIKILTRTIETKLGEFKINYMTE
jgi:hypothetical protein